MKFFLWSEDSSRIAVEINGNEVIIGEEGNMIRLNKQHWNELVSKIKSGALGEI